MVSSNQLKGVDNLATNKNITMKQFNGTDYDTLYPKTKLEQVEGAYTQQQILANSTKTLYGLDATAVPDDALKKIKTLLNSTNDRIDTVNANVESKAKIESGSYVGIGATTKKLTFKSTPKIVFIKVDDSQFNHRMWFIWGQTYACFTGEGMSYLASLTYSGNSVTLSASSGERAMNYKNWKYGYVALG